MSDIEIARAASKKPIQEIAAKIGISNEHILPYGHDKAKVSEAFIKSLSNEKDGHLILVTAINPTPAGEGKTTTTVGLGDGLNAIGKKAAVCIREASLGPCFGMKGGAAGGGYAQVVPMEEMNLHFTGDFHAITSAHNLLSAMLDGIHQNLSPGKPVTGDGYANTKPKSMLPVYMQDAVRLFSESDFIRKAMGAELQRIYTLTKEQEIAEFRRRITSLEYQSFLEIL